MQRENRRKRHDPLALPHVHGSDYPGNLGKYEKLVLLVEQQREFLFEALRLDLQRILARRQGLLDHIDLDLHRFHGQGKCCLQVLYLNLDRTACGCFCPVFAGLVQALQIRSEFTIDLVLGFELFDPVVDITDPGCLLGPQGTDPGLQLVGVCGILGLELIYLMGNRIDVHGQIGSCKLNEQLSFPYRLPGYDMDLLYLYGIL